MRFLTWLRAWRQKASGLDLVTHVPAPSNNWLSTTTTSGGTGGWFGVIHEAFAGAWQRNIRYTAADVLTYGTVWSCITLIAGDIAKLWVKLVRVENGIATETENPAFSPVLRKPNHFSTWVKFIEHWIISKFFNGNTYVLKARDGRGVVTALYVLDPSRVQVLVAPNGDVFYQLNTDYLAGIDTATITVPAREIIHDICVPLYHPLVGVSPIHACGLAAMQGLKIQQQSAKFFGRGLSLSGLLVAPGAISQINADRLEKLWNEQYRGEENAGKIAVVGDGMKFEKLVMSAVDAQLIEQLKWTSENVCACFHVPGYMVGIGPPPPYTDIQSINLQYYTQALQNPIENLETLLDEGLALPPPFHVEFDLWALARMDPPRQMEFATKGVSGGILSINEARALFDRPPVTGGEEPLLQQQNWPISQLADRPLPWDTPPPASPPTPALDLSPPAAAAMNGNRAFRVLVRGRAVEKGLCRVA